MAKKENEILAKLQAAQQKINKIAREYFESRDEQKIALQQKIIDKVLQYVMRVDESADEGIVMQRMIQMEQWSENAAEAKDYFNAEVIFKTINYCLKTYEPAKGDFMNMFNSSYKKRNAAAYAEEKNRKYLRGFSQSKREQEMVRSMNNLVETLGREDVRFAGKKAYDLSIDEIDEILSRNHIEMSPKERKKMIEVLKRYSDITKKTSSYEEMEELRLQAEAEEDKSNDSTYESDSYDIAYETYDNEKNNENNNVSALFKAIFERANKNQKRYFSCFVVQDLVNSEAVELKKFLLPYIDKEFFSQAEAAADNGKITNKLIAGFLEVKEPAVSKKRSDYERLLNEEKGRMNDKEKY